MAALENITSAEGLLVIQYGFYALLGYVLYKLFFVPMDRIRRVTDVGYSYIHGPGRSTVIKRLQRNRRLGKCPPAFPNGWFVVAESREVRI